MSTRRPGFKPPADLDPEDLAARLDVRDELKALRIAAGISQFALQNALGWSHGDANRRETYPLANYTLPVAITWANAFDHSFTLTPVNIPNYRDTAAARLLQSLGGDVYAAAAVIDRMVTARRTTSTQAQMARRLDVHCAAVSRLERDGGDTALVSSWQKYARAMGGRLNLTLTPFDAVDAT